MKSNVKAAPAELLRVRRRVLTLLGLGTAWAGGAAAMVVTVSCKSTADPSDGLVAAPMLPASEALALAPPEGDAGDGGRDASMNARLMPEPRPPAGMSGCTPRVQCLDSLLTLPPWPYPHPFERCDPDPPGDAGHFSAAATTERRRDAGATCCYVNYADCSRRSTGRPHVVRGRPLRDGAGEMIVAGAVAKGGWAGRAGDHDHGAGDGTQQNAGVEWLEAAAMEHASVAEFARLSLVLLALGAPAHLLEATHRAALDEIEHARLCYAEASRRVGRTLGPGPLRLGNAMAASVSAPSVRALARETLLEGCVGECVASLVLGERSATAAMAADTHDAELFGIMARDEERHAELAWQILRFLLEIDPEDARAGIGDALAALDATARDEMTSAVVEIIVRPCAAELAASCTADAVYNT